MRVAPILPGRASLRRPSNRRARLGGLLPIVALTALSGCGAPTGVDATVLGADRLGATQINLVASVAGEPLRMATLPDPQRPLGRREDVRILVADQFAGQVLLLHATPIVAGNARSAAAVDGAGELVAGRIKQILLCFDPAGCDGY